MSSRPKYGVLDSFLRPQPNTPSVGPMPPELLAILGADSFGVAAPHEGINHCLSLSPILPGRVAFITQSGALGAAILDWACQQKIGFSKFIAFGQSPSIGFGECIDYLAEDPYTHSILIYLESVSDASHFLSAARECALRKPIIVLKPGRGDGKKDGVYDAVFRRAGILRVNRIADLFYMAEVLERQPRPTGPNLAILTNANGPALIAADTLKLAGGELLCLQNLATPEDFAQALTTLAKDPNCHGILTILTPQPQAKLTEIAAAIAAAAKGCRKTLLASLMGGDLMDAGQTILAEARIPTFPYADTAAKVFQRLWQYARSLSGLYETPVFTEDPADPVTLATDRAFGLNLNPEAAGTRFTLTSKPDQNFGPILELSASGIGADIYGDTASALPPLNSTLARRTIEMIQLHRACSPAALQSLEDILVRISRIVSEVPTLRELRLELAVTPAGVIEAIATSRDFYPEGQTLKCAIRPYPQQYVKPLTLRNNSVALLRPIRPEDESRIADFHSDLSERTVYLRYLQFLKLEERIDHDRLARVCFNDYSRELALVVELDNKILGVGRMQRNPLRMEEAEVAFLVRDSAQGQGIGKALVANLIAAAKQEGLTQLTAELLADNKPMRNLLEHSGFKTRLALDGQTLLARLSL